MKGMVKFYNDERGFGFIKANNSDYFVHARDVKNLEPRAGLVAGQYVEFEPQLNAKGKTAKNVQLIGD